MFKPLSEGVKAAIAFFCASVVSIGISYITTPIFTRLLTPDEYGTYTVFMTWTSVFGIFCMYCLNYGVFNNGMLDFKNDRNGFAFSLLILSNIITVIFGIVVLLIYDSIEQVIGINKQLLIVMFTVFLVQPAYNFYIAKNRYEYKYKTTFIVAVLLALLTPISAIVCMTLMPDQKLYARILGSELFLVVVYAVFYFIQVRRAHGKVNTKYWIYALRFNTPLIPHYLSMYILGSSDKIMIAIMVGKEATAYYSVAYSISSLAAIMWSAINASMVPYTYDKCEKKDYKSLAKATNIILSVFVGSSVVVILLAPELLSIMASNEYREAVMVIPPVVGGVFFQVCYYLFANVVYYNKRTVCVMVASVISMILNVALNYIMIPRYGYTAAGFTTLASYLVQAGIDYWAMRKVAKNSVYDQKVLCVMTVIMLAISIFSPILYSNNLSVIRYITLAAILLIGFLYRERILGVIKTIKVKKG